MGSDILECMREKDMQEILDQEYSVEDYTLNLYPFVPVIDDDVIPASPEKIMEQKAFSKDKDILIGSNSQEGFWSLMYLMPDLMPNEELTMKERTLTPEEFKKRVNTIFSFYPSLVS